MSTRRYMSMTEIAEYLGVKTGSLAHTKMPEPAVIIGKVRGWDRKTIEEWAQTRRRWTPQN